MTPRDLHKSFRRDVADVASQPLWSDEEIYEYMNWSIDQFCIGWGGIVDSSSPMTLLKAVPNQPFAKLDTRIRKIKAAWSVTNNRRIDVLNLQDMLRSSYVDDYGFAFRQVYDTTTGTVSGLVTDMEPDKVRWIDIPEASEDVRLTVLRMSKRPITCKGEGEIEIGDEFSRTLLLGMKAQAYDKQDAETFDKSKAERFLDLFNQYVRQARSLREARESKVRTVAYGGVC